MHRMVKIRGHRGAAALAPENTLEAFDRALDAGVDAVEFDVRRTADDELVVIHDETLDRTTDGSGYVSDYTVDDIQALEAGDGAAVPTLDEALAYFSDQEDAVDELRLEVKEYDTVWDIYHSVRDYDLLDKTVFHSFQLSALEELYHLDPSTRTSYAVMEPYDGVFAEAQEAGCDMISFHYGNTDPASLREAEEYGFGVDLWAVDGAEDLEGASAMDPDYIGADDPELAQQVLKDGDQVPEADAEGYA